MTLAINASSLRPTNSVSDYTSAYDYMTFLDDSAVQPKIINNLVKSVSKELR